MISLWPHGTIPTPSWTNVWKLLHPCSRNPYAYIITYTAVKWSHKKSEKIFRTVGLSQGAYYEAAQVFSPHFAANCRHYLIACMLSCSIQEHVTQHPSAKIKEQKESRETAIRESDSSPYKGMKPQIQWPQSKLCLPYKQLSMQWGYKIKRDFSNLVSLALSQSALARARVVFTVRVLRDTNYKVWKGGQRTVCKSAKVGGRGSSSPCPPSVFPSYTKMLVVELCDWVARVVW